ncbi:MAG TPA: 2'-5' RNA ligase family protein, partial [Anaerolineae bacterium]
MHGVVTILDEAHYERVEALWADLKREFGVGNANVVHYPHFSYHVAGDYDLDRLAAALEAIARETAAFTVKASGLGIFTGPEPVLYVPVVRSAALTALHQRVWTAVEHASRDSIAYYAPDLWLPHITLGQG